MIEIKKQYQDIEYYNNEIVSIKIEEVWYKSNLPIRLTILT